LNGRIADGEVSEHDIAFDPGNERDSVCVAQNDVVNDEIVIRARRGNADAEVAALTRVSISSRPVPTEPVAACAIRQSYAAARSRTVAIPYRSVIFDVVIGSGGDENTGPAIRRCSHLRHKYAGTASTDLDSLLAKSLDDSRSLDDGPTHAVDENPGLIRDIAAPAACGSVGLSRDGKPIQLERDAGCTERDACGAGDGAGDVADKLAIVGDRQRAGNGAPDIGSRRGRRVQENARAKDERCDGYPDVSHVTPRFSLLST
jgi:hypothetical protein